MPAPQRPCRRSSRTMLVQRVMMTCAGLRSGCLVQCPVHADRFPADFSQSRRRLGACCLATDLLPPCKSVQTHMLVLRNSRPITKKKKLFGGYEIAKAMSEISLAQMTAVTACLDSCTDLVRAEDWHHLRCCGNDRGGLFCHAGLWLLAQLLLSKGVHLIGRFE